MGATVENGAETPVEEQDQDLETQALADAREEDGSSDPQEPEEGWFDPAPGGEKVPQTHTLKFTKVEGAGAPPDLKRGEYVYFEGVAKITSAAVKDKLDKETFVTLEAVKVIEAQVTDLRFDRGHNGPELDPDQQSLGVG